MKWCIKVGRTIPHIIKLSWINDNVRGLNRTLVADIQREHSNTMNRENQLIFFSNSILLVKTTQLTKLKKSVLMESVVVSKNKSYQFHFVSAKQFILDMIPWWSSSMNFSFFIFHPACSNWKMYALTKIDKTYLYGENRIFLLYKDTKSYLSWMNFQLKTFSFLFFPFSIPCNLKWGHKSTPTIMGGLETWYL